MSKAVGNGDLQLMAEYDFKTPIDTTVIIYDSDDDIKPSIEKELIEERINSSDNNKNIDNIVSEIFEDISKLTKNSNQGTKFTIRKRRTSSESTNHKKNKVAENITGSNNTELMLQNQAKVVTGDHTANIISHNQAIFREDHNSNSNQIATSTLQGSNEMQPLAFLPQVTQNQDDIYKKASDCLQTLLDTVSTHMVFIMIAYSEYIVISKTTSDRTLLETARNNFRDTKSRLFYLSFSAVANIMLPKENDSAFIDKFIDDTVKLAETKHFYFKQSDMKLLCAEMFSWVKSHVRHPLIAGLLAKKPTELTTTNTNICREQYGCDKSHNAIDKTCVFTGGPTGRELTINVTSAVIQNSQNNMQQFHDSVPNVPSRQIAQPRDDMRNTNYSYLQQFEHFNATYNFNRQHQYKSKRRGAKSAQRQIHHHPTSPPQKTSRPPAPLPYHLTQTWHHGTHNYANPQNHSDDYLVNAVHYDSIQAEQEEVEVNRSLSRDSGFMSPMSSVSNDPMCCSPRYEKTDSSATSVTPLITHVTSLNPSVAFIKDGICHVCGKLTRQMCLGCYKFYYCSIECQNHDWKFHVLVCK